MCCTTIWDMGNDFVPRVLKTTVYHLKNLMNDRSIIVNKIAVKTKNNLGRFYLQSIDRSGADCSELAAPSLVLH